MITKDDIFIVEVRDQMVLGAVHYAEKSLHYTFNRMGSRNPYDRVRNIVKGIIMELAFKRLLDYHEVKYELLGHTHWTKRDRYDVGINGHRYDVKGFLVRDPMHAMSVKNDPGWLLDCSALVPSDQIKSKSMKNDDYYVFPFIVGEFDQNQGVTLFDSVRYKYLIHTFWDYAWIKYEESKNIGQLKIVSKMQAPFHFRIGGQDANKESLIEEFDLAPGASITTENQFFTVLFTQTIGIPSGDLIVCSDVLEKPEVINTTDWGNIWFYDGSVYFTGYLSKGEFKRNSHEIPRFYKDCKQYSETKTVNRSIFIQDLDPLYTLLPKDSNKFVPAE